MDASLVSNHTMLECFVGGYADGEIPVHLEQNDCSSSAPANGFYQRQCIAVTRGGPFSLSLSAKGKDSQTLVLCHQKMLL